MTDYYINSDTGDNGNSGTVGSPWATIEHARTQASDDDRIIVMYAGGTAYVLTAQVVFSSTTDRMVVTGRDSAGVIFADDPGGFNRSERPLIQVNYAGGGFGQTATTDLTFAGLEIDGVSGTGTEAYWSTTATAPVIFWGCYVHDFNVRGIRARLLTMRETRVSGTTGDGVEIIETPMTAESCIFDGNDLAIDKFNATHTVTLRNCTFYQNDATTYPIDTPGTNWTIQNCLWVDNLTSYALDAPNQETGNAYTSDGGTYHTSGNYNGTPDVSDDLELDPGFENAGAGDFHITNNTLITGGTANSVARLFDGTAMPATPPIGALGELLLSITNVTVDSATQLTVDFNTPYDTSTTADDFSFTFQAGSKGLLPKVISTAAGANSSQIVLTLSAPGMSGGTAYTLNSTTGRP